jgi:hypothetical protein
MVEALSILCESGGDTERATKDNCHECLGGAVTALLVELLQNSFLPLELLSESLLAAEELRTTAGDDDRRIERVTDTLSLKMCLNSVESICRAADSSHDTGEESADCQRRACERVLRRRWRNALRFGEEQTEELQDTIREYLQLYPREYSSLLVGMLSPSAVEHCVKGGSLSAMGNGSLSSTERDRWRYDTELTNLSIVRFLEELTVGEGLHLWERAARETVASACHASEDFLKFFLSTAADVLSGQDLPEERKAKTLALLRHFAHSPPSLPQKAATEMLALLGA